MADDPPDPVDTWLNAVKAVLLSEGFRRDARQVRKQGQAWGLIRQEPDDLQLHVRAFNDGRLESEMELSNKYVQHLWSHRRNAAPELKQLLEQHGFPTERVSETFIPVTGSKEGKAMPETRTRDWHVATAVAVGLGLMVGKHYLQRIVLRRVPRSRGLAAARKVLARK